MICGRKAHLLALLGLTLILLSGLACGVVYGSNQDIDRIIIDQGGTYTFEGALNQTQIYVRAGDEDVVTICLAGVNITNLSGPAIYIENAEQTILFLEEGTENIVQSGVKEDSDKDTDAEEDDSGKSKAAIYSRDDLTITGPGSLQVLGYINNGIQTTNDLVIDSGTIQVEAENIGMKGKDSVTVTGGSISVVSGADGIRANDTTGDGYGTVTISGGSFTIDSGADGIQAETALTISGGEFTISSGGGSAAAEQDRSADNFPDMLENTFRSSEEGFVPSHPEESESEEEFVPRPSEGIGPEEESVPHHPEGIGPEEEFIPRPLEEIGPEAEGVREGPPEVGPGQPTESEGRERPHGNKRGIPGNKGEDFEGFPEIPEDESEASAEESVSSKGLKSGTEMLISGGIFTVDSCDDAFHSDGSMAIRGGTFYIESGDDGIHAETELGIAGGEIQISECYEGLEANQIWIADGSISITSSDDGINANGGTERGDLVSDETEELPCLSVRGGTIWVNAGGDGLDSNGNILIEGGSVIVDGPSDGGNGAIDSGSEIGGTCIVNGGTVLAVGNSGMAETFDEASGQCSFRYDLDFTFNEGSEIKITDMDGNVLCCHTAVKSGNSIVFSAPELKQGETYVVTADGQQTEIILASVSTTAGTGGRGNFRF